MSATKRGERHDRIEDVYGPVADGAHCPTERRRTLEQVVELAVEIAREGREGRRLGTIFVVGDTAVVMTRSRPLLLDPLFGHPADLRHVSRPDFRETVKALAQLDGAFLVDEDGTFIAAARLLDIDIDVPDSQLIGLGARHAAGASITHLTDATAVVVSQSAIVRVFSAGEIVAEIIPELFLISRESLHAENATLAQLPGAGLTLALAGASGSGAQPGN